MTGSTNTKFKDFGKTTAIDDYPAITFRLNGEDFTCRAAMPGTMLLDFVRRADSDSGGLAAEAVVDFLRHSLEETDSDRFKAMVDDPEQIVQVETLGEIVGWLIEQYTARPTKARSRSSNGRSSAGRTSTDTSSDEEST